MKQMNFRWIYQGVALISVIPLPTFAYDLNFDPTVGSITNPLSTYTKLGKNDPTGIVFAIVNTSLIFLGLITVIFIIVSGFMWLFAAGEEEKIKKAKDILKGSVTGLVIIMASYGLAQYIFTALSKATAG